MKPNSPEMPTVVPFEQWLAARREFLREEKEFSKLRDRLAARRRTLPWVKIDRPYIFASPRGPVTLADLFEGRSQLIIYHFMLGPGWEEGCRGCSYVSDHFDGARPHLDARDVSFAAVSCAPLPEIERFKKRMGWGFHWMSSHGTAFQPRLRRVVHRRGAGRGQGQLQFWHEGHHGGARCPGLSVFARDAAGDGLSHLFHLCARARLLINTYNLLDLVPKGPRRGRRGSDEMGRHHDRYDQPADGIAAH